MSFRHWPWCIKLIFFLLQDRIVILLIISAIYLTGMYMYMYIHVHVAIISVTCVPTYSFVQNIYGVMRGKIGVTFIPNSWRSLSFASYEYFRWLSQLFTLTTMQNNGILIGHVYMKCNCLFVNCMSIFS